MEIKIENQTSQLAIGCRMTMKRVQLAKNMKDMIQDLQQYITELNGEIISSPFVIYHNMKKNMDITIGVCIKDEIRESNKYKLLYTAQGKSISTIHEGSYMWLGRTYKKMNKFIKRNQLNPLYLAYEYYYNSPEIVKRKELKTKVILYVK